MFPEEPLVYPRSALQRTASRCHFVFWPTEDRQPASVSALRLSLSRRECTLDARYARTARRFPKQEVNGYRIALVVALMVD